jgi:GNAT superfamily N-acetyltransferase
MQELPLSSENTRGTAGTGTQNRQPPGLRFALPGDTEAVNRVVKRAIMGWDLPDRVKRLSLPLYLYDAHDFEHMDIQAAEYPGAGIVGIAAWEAAHSRDAPAGCTALLLHGIYVLPEYQGRGVGSALLHAAELAACGGGFDGLLVRAQRDARGFFVARGLQQLVVEDAARDYGHRFWKSLRGSQVWAS